MNEPKPRRLKPGEPFKRSVELHEGGGWAGYCAVIYTDDGGASGNGNNPMVGYWYGTRQDCHDVPATEVDLYPARWAPDFTDIG
mgnify:CR=1 FL=1